MKQGAAGRDLKALPGKEGDRKGKEAFRALLSADTDR